MSKKHRIAKTRPSNSMQRVLAVLEVFTEEHTEWKTDELMAELGHSRPTLYRYLKHLKDAGFLVSTRNSGVTLGPRIVEMDYLIRRSDPLILYGQPHLNELAHLYQCNALLLRWYGNKILCVASAAIGDGAASSYVRGRPMPLGRGAIARSIIAYLPRREAIPLIERNLHALRAVGLGSSADEIFSHLAGVRRDGYAVAYSEVTPGVIGIAAPVLQSARQPIASLCVSIGASLLRNNQISEIGNKLVLIAASVVVSYFRKKADTART
jgi:DNA-binding IclR family transcriptional regulator